MRGLAVSEEGGDRDVSLLTSSVVQVKRAHDLERFALPNDNIILVDNNPDMIAKKVIDLIENNYDEAIRIGQNGKATAIEKFSYERFKNDWLKFINEVLKIKL